ncbi:Pyridoxal reductase, chloroplastic [Glycine soja]
MAVSVCSININPIALATPSFSFKSLKFPSFWPTQKVKMGPLSVSPMRFGTWAWGTTASISLIFDTADSYGTGKLNGQGEKLLGRLFENFKTCIVKQKGSQRERVIATKFAAYPWRLTPGQFVNACRASLDRMQIEQIGMGQLHRSTTNYAPLQELALWDGLVAILQCYAIDLVKAVGVSNYGPKQLLKAPWSPLVLSPDTFDKTKDYNLVQFSLLSTGKYQLKIKSICDSLGIRMIAYSPLGLGMLTGKYSSSKLPSGPRALLFKQILPGLDPLLSSLREIANKRRKTMSQVIFFLCCYKLVHRFQLLESNQLNKLRKIWVLFVGASPQTSCFSWRMQQMNHLAG